jgi:predicted dehydrogenase
MRVLVTGLGSMGKRRVRNLRAIGDFEIGGFDVREDRTSEAVGLYGVTPFASWEEAVREFAPTAMIISTGPADHMDYALPAAETGIHCFIEASVVDAPRIRQLRDHVTGSRTVIAPSCTMRYFPMPRLVGDVVRSGEIGAPLVLNYQTGQYLPDWHPWERIEDFYVSRRETGGCREIVPFELTWLNDIFGDPEPLACVKDKVTDLPADIDDVYHCVLRYPGGLLANITVEVISRPRPTRELRILGSRGVFAYSGDEGAGRRISHGEDEWTRYDSPEGTIEAGYVNPEEPYIAEMRDFIRAVEAEDGSLFPNDLDSDLRVLDLLRDLESLAGQV